MIVKQLTLGVAQTNCYVVGCKETGEGVIIDPADDGDTIMKYVNDDNLSIKYVLNTHAHFDHVLANEAVIKATGAPLALHPLDLPLLQANGGAAFFWPGRTPQSGAGYRVGRRR